MNEFWPTHTTKSGRPCHIVRYGSVVCTIMYDGQPDIWSYPTACLTPNGSTGEVEVTA